MTFETVFCVAGAVLLNVAGCLGQLDVCGRAPLNTKIVGGADVTEGSWPWQVSINYAPTGDMFCSGSLINKEWVLSAAHVFAVVPASEFVVYLGRLTQNGTNPYEKSKRVKQIIKHPNYTSIGSDIALLQLSSSVTFTDYIKPVCLAAAFSVFVDGTESWVTGWGSTNTAATFEGLQFPDILQEVEAPIVDNIECKYFYGQGVTDNMICAGLVDEDGKAPCVGDPGSPLVTRQGSQWIQSGVMVAGICGQSGFPTIYVRVSEYEDWISNYTSSSLPGFVSYPLTLDVFNGGSINVLSFPLAFSIIPLIISQFF